MQKYVVILLLTMLPGYFLFAQESASPGLSQVPSKFLSSVSSNATALNNKLNKKTEKLLQQLTKQEARMKKKLQKTDSLAANKVFINAGVKYKELEQRLENTSLKQYMPRLDSLSTSLKFLKLNPQLLSQTKEAKEKLEDALSKVKGLESRFQKADEIKKFLKERRDFLKEQLSKFGFAKQLKKLNKQAYYYAQQLNEYRNILNDPKKIESKALELLGKTKFFQDFFRKHSLLASLFRQPGDPNDPGFAASLAGLQTRTMVQQTLTAQFGTGPQVQQQLQQNMNQAQGMLNELKNKIRLSGGSASDDDMPDFKPNNQKTKSFWKRIELGTNIQSQKATNLFPVRSEIGLSAGYRINDKSVAGVGAGGRIGWGRGWNNIQITGSGYSFRSFLDIKLKGSFWLSGGYERNYRSEIRNIDQLRNRSAWSSSGLAGITKTISLKTKFFKKTKLQLLWDFLSYQQVPRTQPVVVRFAYSFSQ